MGSNNFILMIGKCCCYTLVLHNGVFSVRPDRAPSAVACNSDSDSSGYCSFFPGTTRSTFNYLYLYTEFRRGFFFNSQVSVLSYY